MWSLICSLAKEDQYGASKLCATSCGFKEIGFELLRRRPLLLYAVEAAWCLKNIQVCLCFQVWRISRLIDLLFKLSFFIEVWPPIILLLKNYFILR